jgi:cell division protein FtsZ
MTIKLSLPAMTELKPRITVVGVGGAGGNAVNNMINAQLEGVEFVVANTDAQALSQSMTDHRLQIGTNVTQGLGAGSNPEIGAQAAEESMAEIMDALAGSHMIFIAAGMGGGTGTGAAPAIARAARDAGMLTVGVATKPFQFEGAHRMAVAEAGIEAFEEHVDTLIVIPNQNLFRVANEKTTFADAFKMADDVLYSGVRGVTDLMVMPGLINLDFADVRTVMMEMGKAMMGTGEAEGEERAIEAAEAAISNPLLDEVSMKGARCVLINITGGPDEMTLHEVDLAINRIRDEVDPQANIIFGSIFDDSLEGRMRVSVVATGIDAEQAAMPRVHRPYLAVEAGAEVAETEGPAAQPGFVFATGGASPDAVSPPAMVSSIGGPVDTGGAAAVARMDPVASAAPMAAVASAAARHVEEPFIAPPPLRPEIRRTPLRAPDPFAEAALENAPAAPPKKRTRATLLERMASVGLGRTSAKAKNAASESPAGEDEGHPVVSEEPPVSEPPAPTDGVRLETLSPASEPEPVVDPAPVTEPEPAEPSQLAPEPDEDLLEIPAFLRRQAN